VGHLEMPAFGPQMTPFSDTSRFGIEGSLREERWFCASAYKEIWFQLEPSAQEKGCSFSLQAMGLTPAAPIAWVFYVRADICHIQGKAYKPKSLNRFLGEEQRVQFSTHSTHLWVDLDRPLKLELIPLAGEGPFWGASFLLAVWLAPHTGKVSFSLHQ
jgi:hypothetical protein